MWQGGGMALTRPADSLAPMRDRITTFFAAVHEAASGTKRDIGKWQGLCVPLLFKAKSDFFEWNADDFRTPSFAAADRHCERQRSRRNNFAGMQRWVMRIVRQQFDQMP